MRIYYHGTTKRIRIEARIHQNHMIAQIPSKRWYKQANCWVVPILARNCQYILDHLADYAEPEAIAACQESVNKRKIVIEPFPVWYQFGTEPMIHQKQALDFGWSLKAVMLDMEMGTGKSKTVIDLTMAKMVHQSVDLTVIFCPVPLRRNWINEIKIHVNNTYEYGTFIVDDMSSKSRQKALATFMDMPCKKYLIVGIESLQQGYQKGYTYKAVLDAIAGRPYFAAVDESHKVKNPDATRSQNIEFLMSASLFNITGTGTMIGKGILDLYMQYTILDKEILGFSDYYSFRNRYAEMGGFENREVIGYNNVDELMGLIRPYTFTATKDILNLPPKVMTKRYITLTPEQLKAYKEIDKKGATIVADMLARGENVDVVVEHVLAQHTLKQQICSGFMVINDEKTNERRMIELLEPDKNPKIRELLSVLEDSRPGEKFIVWARFRKEISDIAAALRSAGVSFIEYHGGIPDSERAGKDIEFNTGTAKVFLSNQQTGGTGLTLNSATVTYYYSNTFSYIDRVQSEDRNHRKGQHNTVLYIDAMVENSVEEDIRAVHESGRDFTAYIREQITAGRKSG